MNSKQVVIIHRVMLVALMIGGQMSWAQKPELVVPIGHKGPVTDVAFSEDGKYALSGADGTEITWDLSGLQLDTHRPFAYAGEYFQRRSEGITGLGFPTYRGMTSWSQDNSNELKVLSAIGWRVLEHEGPVLDAKMLADDKYLLTLSKAKEPSESLVISRWDVETGRRKFIGLTRYTQSIAYSSDGAYFLHGDLGRVSLWNINSGEDQIFLGHAGKITAVSLSRDNKYFLSGGEDNIVRLWNRNGNIIQVFEGHTAEITSVCFSPTQPYILTGSKDNTARIWNWKGEQLQVLSAHDGPVNSVAFSPNGQLILTGSNDFTARLWDLGGNEVQQFKGRTAGAVHTVSYAPDGVHVLIANEDTTARIWNLRNQKIRLLHGHTGAITSAAFSPVSKYLVTGSEDHTLRLWNFQGKPIKTFQGHEAGINDVAISPDGKRILSGSEDRTARLWNLRGKNDRILSPHTKAVTSVAFSPDRKQILTGSKSGEVRLWKPKSEKSKVVYSEYYGITSVAFFPDNKHILMATSNEVRMEDPDDFWSTQRLVEPIDKPGHMTSASLSPDGSLVLTASEDGTARLWNLTGNSTEREFDYSTNEVQTFQGHTGPVTAATFSENGEFILTGSTDYTARIWSKHGYELVRLIALDSSEWIILDPDNYYMASKGGAKAVHFKVDGKVYGFDQFDLRLNRPDIILERLPVQYKGKADRIKQYREAYYERLKQNGFTEDMLSDTFLVPECVVPEHANIPFTTSDPILQLPILATDRQIALDRLYVYVNGVPIYGSRGIDLRPYHTQSYRDTLAIPLAPGTNKIQVSVLNQGGAESLKTTDFVTCMLPKRKPDLYLITIGVTDYKAPNMNLKYADKDARDIDSVYKDHASFRQVHSRHLTNKAVTRENVLALKAWLQESQVDDEVIIFASGHGTMDTAYDFYFGAHDIDFGNPAERGILYQELEGLLDGIPARKKLLLIDACHSGEYDKEGQRPTKEELASMKKSGVVVDAVPKSPSNQVPAFRLQTTLETTQWLFTDLRRGSGATVITSSAGAQYSYEKGSYKNGIFTYVFLNGLQSMAADTNGDQEVSASEIQAYLEKYVPRLTQGKQRPAFRQQNLEFDFRVW